MRITQRHRCLILSLKIEFFKARDKSLKATAFDLSKLCAGGRKGFQESTNFCCANQAYESGRIRQFIL